MKVQSRLMMVLWLLFLGVPVGASELIISYPKIYHKRTAYYDSLASQLKSDIGLDVKVVEPEEVKDSGHTAYLGGTELFLHGFSSESVDLATQITKLKQQFEQLNEVLPLGFSDSSGALSVDSLSNNGLTPRQGYSTDIQRPFSTILQQNSLDKLMVVISGKFVSTTPDSAFGHLMKLAWDKQFAVISASAPKTGHDFAFTLVFNNQSFPLKLSNALKKAPGGTFIMMPPKKPQTLTVIYPKVKAPHDQVFNQIIDGIKTQFSGSVNLVSVGRKDDKASIAASIDREKPDLVVTLSRSGQKVAKLMKVKTPWVAGAAQILPERDSGISPGGAPSLILRYLNQLAPSIKQVQVVYSPRSRWLIKLAEQAASGIGLTLVKHPVRNRKEAILKYTELFKSSNYKTDAFWLPYDTVTASNKYILPLVLDASWDKRFVVISSIPPHAKRGALLSLYPDNTTTGVNLVKMVEDMHKQSTKGLVIPTSQVMLAVNLRTASHLGLEYSSKQKGEFDFTFPSR